MQQHLSESEFATVRAGGGVPRATLRHLDGCLACRRTFGHAVTPPPSRLPRTRLLAATAALVLVAFVATPLRTVAGSFLEVFQPRTVGFIPVTLADMRQMSRMPDVSAYGTGRTLVASAQRNVADPRAASALARFNVRVPAYGVANATASGSPTYAVTSSSVQQFVFSAAKARATALAKHVALAPMPAGLDGSALDVEIGTSVVAAYSSTLKPTRAAAWREQIKGSLADPNVSSFAPVIVGQMRAPRVFSTGVSAATLESYLIAQPGFPPRLAAELRAIGDPATTLPIPIPVDRSFAQPLIVDGVRGIGIGDETGLGAGVIWQKGDILYGVFAPLAAHDVLAIADSLR